jgi:NDP-sugar pyrophosphorylase family protein
MAKLIRKAVLLAGGRGTRLGDLTAHTPKPLLEVAGEPILAHMLGALAQVGIEEAIIVTGYLAEQIEQFCSRFAAEHGALNVVTVPQPSINGTGGAMLAATPLLGAEQAFLFGWGDVLMDVEFYERFASCARSTEYDLMLALNRVRDPYRGAAVYVDDSMRVTRIVEKPAAGTSTTCWNNAGLFASTPRLFQYVGRLAPSERGELELPLAIAAMIDDGLQIRAIELRGFWSDVGTPEDLARVRRQFRLRQAPR